MPSWSATWADVQFDHGAAEAAAVRLEALAGLLQHSSEALGGHSRALMGQWLGPAGDRFQDKLHAWMTHAQDVGQRFRFDADAVRSASRAATVEQQRRLEERQRWFAELRAETPEPQAGRSPSPEPNAGESVVAGEGFRS